MPYTDEERAALQAMASAFDDYADEHDTDDEDLPMAFGQFLHERTGWTGEVIEHDTGRVVGEVTDA